MSIFNSTVELASNFIVAYYPHFIYDTNMLFKFYKDNCSIYRPEFGTVTKSFSEAKDSLRLELDDEANFLISNYICTEINNGYSLIVQGTIQSPSSLNQFIHSFVLMFYSGRLFIESDIFRYINFTQPTGIDYYSYDPSLIIPTSNLPANNNTTKETKKDEQKKNQTVHREKAQFRTGKKTKAYDLRSKFGGI